MVAPNKQISLEDLGYDSYFVTKREDSGFAGFLMARVVVEHKGVYKIRNESGEYFAKVTGKHMFEASTREDYPAVGDWVAYEQLSDDQAVIRGVLPRRTVIKRKYNRKDEDQIIAANVDVAFVVESVDRDFNLNRFERYFSFAKDGGVLPAIILNKVDLFSAEELNVRILQLRERFKEIPIVLTSVLSDEGLQTLRATILEGKTYCFLGSSGVGKSSLINKLLKKDILRVDDVSASTGRGKHTTTNRELYVLEGGGIVIDNPGMREVGMTDVADGIDSVFDDLSVLAKECKYVDCTHVHEPDCAILALVQSGDLNKEKYANYITLKKEAAHFELSTLEKREKERHFGKYIKSAKKTFKKFDY